MSKIHILSFNQLKYSIEEEEKFLIFYLKLNNYDSLLIQFSLQFSM